MPDETVVLDRRQLREVTMDDQDLMEELLATLLDDTARQMIALDEAIRAQDPDRTRRIAHYCKGACANLGANSVATALREMEQSAGSGHFDDCAAAFARLSEEMAKLRVEVAGICG